MFTRIAIVNRGEPARRLIHATRELSYGHGHAVRTIALHTAEERTATFVREADEGWLIGRPGGGNPYLDHAELARALRESRADAAWVGWGFVAEDPAFADLCESIGVTFIGPPGDVMRRLGDKIAAKLLAEEVGVPVAEWSRGPVETDQEARRHAAAIGFPLMVKAAAGGGGRGIRVVTNESELLPAVQRARNEARRAFGDPSVLMERLVAGARHVEVQVIADNHGTGWAVGVRDCSVQRRSQKLIEESDSPVLSSERERELCERSVDLVLAAGYRGAGTVEFLYQAEEDALAFLEVNTRLQVEHPVTEATTGLDLVKLQLHVASGGRLEGDPPAGRGHAIEARVNAEDPERGFAPAPGRVEMLVLPTGPGIRVDTGVTEGDDIPSAYDSMIAKVIAWGADRDEARARLRRALAEMVVVIKGGATNRTFLMDLLDRPEVISGEADTGWLDRMGAEGRLTSDRHADVALLAAAIEADRAEEALERESFYASARRGRPKANHEITRAVDLRYRGQGYRLSVARTGPAGFRITPAGAVAVSLTVEPLGRFESRVTMNDHVHRVVVMPQSPDTLVEVDGVTHRVSRDEGGLVRAPAPALVVALTAAVGDIVTAGTPVVVLESMKMETSVAAPCDGTVAEILVAGNVQVDAGAPLMRIEPAAERSGAVETAPRVEFTAESAGAAVDPHRRATAILGAIRSLVMGYDVTTAQAQRLVAELAAVREALPPADSELVETTLDVLGVVADLAELSRARPPLDIPSGEEAVHSPREHFHKYLRSLDADREGLPERLRRSLQRALAHYGVDPDEPGPELAAAAYRLYLAQERSQAQFPAVAALLAGNIGDIRNLPDPLRRRFRETLDRLVAATRRRHPAIAELARGTRFAYFERPVIDAARRDMHRRARAQVLHLTRYPDAPDHAARIADLVASSQPMLHMLGERAATGIPPSEPLLEVLTRRYYKIRELHDLRLMSIDEQQMATATYGRSGRRVRLLTTVVHADDLAAGLRTVAAALTDVSSGDGCVVDVYVAAPGQPGDDDATAARLRSAIATAGLPAGVRRLAVSLAYGDGETSQFTFRPDGGAFVEERVTRGLHPMLWRRLRFWRMNDFDITRLDAVDDTYLFRCVAPADPSDERLVALAEVRDLTPIRDVSGRLTGLPEVERVLLACLEGIRRVQATRSARRRLHANHVLLFIWPTVELPLGELTAAARRLAPLTEGLGLEEVLICFSTIDVANGKQREMALRFSYQPGAGVTVGVTGAPTTPLTPVDDYARRVLAARRRGTVYPYELVDIVAGEGGTFTEHDLDEAGSLAPVDRPPGRNVAGVVVGVVSTPTQKHPQGVVRVVLFGDPTRSLGSVAEPECRRIEAAIDLADDMEVPLEWFALSSGAKISRDSGTENMDWVARALRRIVTFTQAGGEVNVVVAGINVGAQPYWNAEATMLMHTKGILVMTPDSAMVLTGKQALDYSGGVSAEDNFGIGGYDRIMGPNGQAQYWAPHLGGACEVLMRHYAHTYIAPGESGPRRAVTGDPADRDVRDHAHSGPGTTFTRVGEIFSTRTNPERKKPFDVRSLMNAVIDQDHRPLERWAGMADAETAVVYDAHLGGYPLTVLGIESRPIARHHFLPADGPDQWTAGTLFPLSSKKVARALNAASGNRPAVVLANLSGFDGSPESLRRWQLEYGAEIGRAVVNFQGPIVFCVVSRYHGGAFVVFSGALNDNMQVLAVEGSYASVIGGAPAAAVVFAGDVNVRTENDARVVEVNDRLAAAAEEDRARLRAELDAVRAAVRSEKLGEVATEFDTIHSVERAREVGSVHEIISAQNLRPRLIDAIEQGYGGGPPSNGSDPTAAASTRTVGPQVGA